MRLASYLNIYCFWRRITLQAGSSCGDHITRERPGSDWLYSLRQPFQSTKMYVQFKFRHDLEFSSNMANGAAYFRTSSMKVQTVYF